MNDPLFREDDDDGAQSVDLSQLSDAQIAAEMVRRGIVAPPAAPAPDPEPDSPSVLDQIKQEAARSASDHVFATMSQREALIEKAVQDTRAKLSLLPEGGESEFRKLLSNVKPEDLPKFVSEGQHHHTATYLVGMAATEGKARMPRPRSGPAPAGGAIPDNVVATQELDDFVNAFGSMPKRKGALAAVQNGGSR